MMKSLNRRDLSNKMMSNEIQYPGWTFYLDQGRASKYQYLIYQRAIRSIESMEYLYKVTICWLNYYKGPFDVLYLTLMINIT